MTLRPFAALLFLGTAAVAQDTRPQGEPTISSTVAFDAPSALVDVTFTIDDDLPTGLYLKKVVVYVEDSVPAPTSTPAIGHFYTNDDPKLPLTESFEELQYEPTAGATWWIVVDLHLASAAGTMCWIHSHYYHSASASWTSVEFVRQSRVRVPCPAPTYATPDVVIKVRARRRSG